MGTVRPGTGLVSCSKAKLPVPAPANYMYAVSGLSCHQLTLAKATNQECVVISALHQVLPWDKWICPYNYSLNMMEEKYQHEWAEKTAITIESEYPAPYRLYAGGLYASLLSQYMGNLEIVCTLPLFQKTKWLKTQVDSLHLPPNWNRGGVIWPNKDTLSRVYGAGPRGIPSYHIEPVERKRARTCPIHEVLADGNIASKAWKELKHA